MEQIWSQSKNVESLRVFYKFLGIGKNPGCFPKHIWPLTFTINVYFKRNIILHCLRNSLTDKNFSFFLFLKSGF